MATKLTFNNGRVRYELGKFRAGGVVPYYIRDGKVRILICKEREGKKGIFNIIGGKVEPGDDNIYTTIRREFHEETAYIFGSSSSRKKIKQLLNNQSISKYFHRGKYKILFCPIDLLDERLFNMLSNLPDMFERELSEDEERVRKSSEVASFHWIDPFDLELDIKTVSGPLIEAVRMMSGFKRVELFSHL